MPKLQISLIFLILALLESGNSLYFLLDSGQEKCVFDDIPKSQVSFPSLFLYYDFSLVGDRILRVAGPSGG